MNSPFTLSKFVDVMIENNWPKVVMVDPATFWYVYRGLAPGDRSLRYSEDLRTFIMPFVISDLVMNGEWDRPGKLDYAEMMAVDSTGKSA